MLILQDWTAIPPEAHGATLALGNFDGVHRGHEYLLRHAHSARPDAKLAVLTFEPHPREFFRPEDPPFRLMSAEERRGALAAQGVKILFELPFNAAFSTLPAASFVEDVLHRGCGAAHVACGEDFAFGHRRGGDVAFLEGRAEALGLGLTVVPPFLDGGAPVSSSRIRRLLQDGYPERAARVLGRAWSLSGTVQQGQQRGRTIGFPTANIALDRHLEPARGVYAITAMLPDGGTVPGVANIGVRPTVGGQESRLEVHLFDWSGDLYGQSLTVSLHHFLRGEQRFPDFEALRRQIAVDADAARALLQQTSAP